MLITFFLLCLTPSSPLKPHESQNMKLSPNVIHDFIMNWFFGAFKVVLFFFHLISFLWGIKMQFELYQNIKCTWKGGQDLVRVRRLTDRSIFSITCRSTAALTTCDNLIPWDPMVFHGHKDSFMNCKSLTFRTSIGQLVINLYFQPVLSVCAR